MDKLLHIADLHFWRIVWNPLQLINKRLLGNANVLLRRRHEFPMQRAEEFADAVAATGIETALLTGDFTSTATDAEFELAAAFVRGLVRRGLRVWALPGNHDVYTFEAVRKRRFDHYLGEFLPEGGLPAAVRLPGGTPLVLVPTVRPNLLSARGHIRQAEVEHAAALLADAPPGPVLVAGHYPVLHQTSGYASSWGRRLRNADALRAVLGSAGRPILYLAGHVHRFSCARDPEYPHVQHLTTPAFFLERRSGGGRGAFTEIHVEAREFAVFRHFRRDTWTREPAIQGQTVV
ncbi:MAG TPA: metallophosphoesterase [Candidatus Hydrogenedentes bacterium]|nr:metallophosphoesterase [Candidatus Hydrogenedentota bacterium]HNT86700.1 metallophosphoesterase [Candidatus Hydrogenedentota bacterium]